jgi:cation diffusion facilitator CzcD-associated flavoprotein CzcO
MSEIERVDALVLGGGIGGKLMAWAIRSAEIKEARRYLGSM